MAALDSFLWSPRPFIILLKTISLWNTQNYLRLSPDWLCNDGVKARLENILTTEQTCSSSSSHFTQVLSWFNSPMSETRLTWPCECAGDIEGYNLTVFKPNNNIQIIYKTRHKLYVKITFVKWPWSRDKIIFCQIIFN